MIAYEKLVEDFEFLDDWEDKYRYVIEIGRDLEDMPESDKTDENKVQGCVSQVWLTYEVDKADPEDPVIRFKGDSDAHIVRGLVAIMLSAYSGKRASEIVKLDENDVFSRLGLIENLTPQRANGLRAMVKRIKQEAAKVAA
ncbi:SufE family protein [Hoeflea sp. WL0058]|uniref:SufE family protein n=1 Tax=Flavimaribacter sediminis TaxID=2865987 RepID=A0AAE2ZR79_9HYPH|nr:SufE family protein [Flavimaribacter sediminis]MBW8639436.1 SufE family protein [Flavimaribacter sediminis]